MAQRPFPILRRKRVALEAVCILQSLARSHDGRGADNVDGNKLPFGVGRNRELARQPVDMTWPTGLEPRPARLSLRAEGQIDRDIESEFRLRLVG